MNRLFREEDYQKVQERLALEGKTTQMEPYR